MNVLIDLRSPTEIEEDENIKASIYEGYTNYYYDKKTGRFNTNIVKTSELSSQGATAEAATAATEATVTATVDKENNKKRFFVSLIDESVIKKGIFKRLRKRTKVLLETFNLTHIVIVL